MNGLIVQLRDDPGCQGQRLRISGYLPHTDRGSLTAGHSGCTTFFVAKATWVVILFYILHNLSSIWDQQANTFLGN